jgi:transposase
VKGLREIVLIHDLRRQGLSISAIARKVGSDRKTVRKYLEQGLEVPSYGPRPLQGSFLVLRPRVFETLGKLMQRLEFCPLRRV